MPGVPTSFATLRLDNASTVDRAAAELRRAIFDGEIESGTPLRELALAESLGVSRPTVREALGMLVSEGLATRQPNRGVNVAAPEASSVRDVCQARFVLEGAGVLRWEQADQVDRDHVLSSLRDYTSSVTAGASYQELNERHLAFHVSLVGLTQSARLVSMAELLVVELKLALAQVDRLRRDSHDQADSHTALVALMQEGDLHGAYEFLRAHLVDASDTIIAALQIS